MKNVILRFFPATLRGAWEKCDCEWEKIEEIRIRVNKPIKKKRKMQEIYIDTAHKNYDNIKMEYLSMGMSGDFREAIACGANIVRIGTAIFGARDYH